MRCAHGNCEVRNFFAVKWRWGICEAANLNEPSVSNFDVARAAPKKVVKKAAPKKAAPKKVAKKAAPKKAAPKKAAKKAAPKKNAKKAAPKKARK